MSGFIKRVLTAIVFVLVMVGGVYLHPYSLISLFGLITALSIWEYLNLTLPTSQKSKNNARKFIGLVIGLLPYAIVASYQVLNWEAETLYSAILAFIPILFLTFIYELFTNSEKPFSNIGILLLGVIYIGIPFALLLFIAFFRGQFSPNIVMGLLLLTWLNDTGAYLIGSQIGKNKLFPRISPGKTWEGSIGGAFVTFGVAWLLSLFLTDLPLVHWLFLAGIVAVFGSLGDLVESMLKRSLQIKDSGNLLPGHGGMLDRFDAFLFLLPFVAAYLLLVVR